MSTTTNSRASSVCDRTRDALKARRTVTSPNQVSRKRTGWSEQVEQHDQRGAWHRRALVDFTAQSKPNPFVSQQSKPKVNKTRHSESCPRCAERGGLST
eukprot:2755936-Rhodomonas_salina.2